MSFVETIFDKLAQDEAPDPLIEVQGKELVPTTAPDLLEDICRVRAYLRKMKIEPGDRVAPMSCLV